MSDIFVLSELSLSEIETQKGKSSLAFYPKKRWQIVGELT